MSAETRSLSLTIDNMDNDAFGEPETDQWREEAARILREAAKLVESGSMGRMLHDINGNKIGMFSVYAN